jgi:hypothetical protein
MPFWYVKGCVGWLNLWGNYGRWAENISARDLSIVAEWVKLFITRNGEWMSGASNLFLPGEPGRSLKRGRGPEKHVILLCWPCIVNCVSITNSMHCLSLVFWINTPLHVSGVSTAHHHEVECIYVANGTVDCQRAHPGPLTVNLDV